MENLAIHSAPKLVCFFSNQVSGPQTIIREVRTMSSQVKGEYLAWSDSLVHEEELILFHSLFKVHHEQSDSGLPVRKTKKKKKVDTSMYMTPYLEHSEKMKDLFSSV